MTSWVGHNKVWNEQTICRGGRGEEFPCMIKAKKKNAHLSIQIFSSPWFWFLPCQSLFPPLLNMRIKKLKIPLTTYCSISLSCRCQQVQHHDTCFQESLASLFFFNSLLIHPLGTNLCHPIWNPKMNSWLLHGGYQKQKAEECSVRKETDIIVYYGFMPCFFFKSCSLDCNILQ